MMAYFFMSTSHIYYTKEKPIFTFNLEKRADGEYVVLKEPAIIGFKEKISVFRNGKWMQFIDVTIHYNAIAKLDEKLTALFDRGAYAGEIYRKMKEALDDAF